jgi:cell division protein FtsB
MTDDMIAALLEENEELHRENFVLSQEVANLESELDEAWRCRDGDDYQ